MLFFDNESKDLKHLDVLIDWKPQVIAQAKYTFIVIIFGRHHFMFGFIFNL